MLEAFQLMLVATGITVVTAFMIAVLIQILCYLVAPRSKKTVDDGAQIALAVALALKQK